MKTHERRPVVDRLEVLPRAKPSSKVRHLDLHSEKVGAKAIGASAVGTTALGSLVVGAIAIGALAIGALAIGRLVIGRARLRRVEIDELVVRRLRITERMQLPNESTQSSERAPAGEKP